MKLIKLPIVALLLLSACQSSGRTYSEMEAANAFPAFEKDNGRIFLYRYSTLGFAVQPPLRIDGNVVGRSVPEGFLFVDLPAGPHIITAETEVEKSLAVDLQKKETIYVEQSAALGWLVGRIELEKTDETQAKNELRDLHYQNDPSAETAKAEPQPETTRKRN